MDSTSSNSLLVIRGLNNDQKGMTYRVQQPIIVGRSRNCDVFIADVRASRQQARFFRQEQGELVVEDLGSLNGTFLNGRQISRQQLQEGDVIRLGSTDFGVQRMVTHSTVEVVEPALPQETQIVKQVSTVELPSLGAMKTHDYLRAIGVSEEISKGEANQTIAALQRKTRNFATLFEISTVVQRYSDPNEMLSAVVDVLLKVPGGDAAYVALLNEHKELIPKVSRDTNGDAGGRFFLSRTVSNYVLEEQCAVIAPDIRNDARFAESQSVILGPTGSILAVPIVVGKLAQGLLAISTEDVRHKPAEDDLDLLCVAASIIGPALHNLELKIQREKYLKDLEAANKKILATQEQLLRAEQMAAIGRLSSGVIHEVKNHLSPLMLADMVAEQYPDDEDIQEMTEMVIEARKRILDLVDEIRMFARGDTRSYNLQPNAISDVTERVVRFVRCDAKVRRTQLKYHCHNQPLVIMDGDRIRQVLINLIQNAADAVHGIDNPEIIVQVYVKEEFACISVSDNGIGIPDEIRGRIFDPLFTTKGENGLGLGLDICSRIIKAHYGQLLCETKPEGGTSFIVQLPLNPPSLSFYSL